MIADDRPSHHERFYTGNDEAAGLCHYCRRPMLASWANTNVSKTVDHIMPRSRGGKNSADNRVSSCRSCNRLKASLTPEEWNELMSVFPGWWETPGVRALYRAHQKATRDSKP